jgi:hypothetical protein
VAAIGRKPESVKAALAEVSRRVGTAQDESVLELQGEKLQSIRDVFGITQKELDTVVEKGDVRRALVNQVAERMALLQTQL